MIPFVGAGFSSTLGMPNWEKLLKSLSEEVVTDMTFDEIKEFANHDYLQIAEYLFIRSDKRIGPLRHVIERLLNAGPTRPHSPSHVELVNLGARQIYTTNYDDLLERTYKELDVATSLVALPKDIAVLDSDKVQIVKYHGDLRHESTLVLTESAYYRRLDLESPMDLKFRSDILGRSVLFMGYSFRDLNIRLIWFKLMQMMQDIPMDDRRPSYIVKLGPNPVQDALFKDVGLHPITLDPHGRYSASDRLKMLAEFLFRLATRAGGDTIPGSSDPMFVSSQLLDSLPKAERSQPRAPGRFYYRAGIANSRSALQFIQRRVPEALASQARERFNDLLMARAITAAGFDAAMRKAAVFGEGTDLAEWAFLTLRGGATEQHRVRKVLMDSALTPWSLIWNEPIAEDLALNLVESMEQEAEWTESGHADYDAVYLADLVRRILDANVLDKKATARATSALARVEAVYPSVGTAVIAIDGPPDVAAGLAEVDARRLELGLEGDPDTDGDNFTFNFDTELLRQLDLEAVPDDEP